MTTPNDLEGTRTPEELAENFRELNRIAPTPAEKFRLMFGQPRETMNEEQQTATYEDFWKIGLGPWDKAGVQDQSRPAMDRDSKADLRPGR
jgi:hypothetical protein